MGVEETSAYFVIVECIFVVITLLLALYTFVRGAVDQVATEDIGKVCCDKRQMEYFVASPPNWWSYYRRRAVVTIPRVPSVDNLIQAGDRLLFTSAMFDHIDSSPQEVGWVSLYKQFFREMSWLEPERTSTVREDSDISKYLEKADNRRRELQSSAWRPVRSIDFRNTINAQPRDEESGHGPEATPREIIWQPKSNTPVRHCLFPPRSKGPPMLICCVLPLEISAFDPTSTLADLTLDNISPLWIINGKPCVKVTREELAGLALALGVPLSNEYNGFSGSGPFGTHIRVVPDGNHWHEWRLRISHQQRQLGREPLNGSGYSTLFAKYIACDCLPLVMLKDEDEKRDISSEVEKDKATKVVRCLHVCPQFVASIHESDTGSFGVAVKCLWNAMERSQSLQPVTSKDAHILGQQQSMVTATQLNPLIKEAERGLWVAKEDPPNPLIRIWNSCPKLKYLDRLPAAHRIDAYRLNPNLGLAYFQTTSDTAATDVIAKLPLEAGVTRKRSEDKNEEDTASINEVSLVVEANEKENKDEIEVELLEENEALIQSIAKALNDNDFATEKIKFGYTLHWFRAVARIAFGGLVPQAGKLLADAVCFTVAGQRRDDHHSNTEKDSDQESIVSGVTSGSSLSVFGSSYDSRPRPGRSSSRHRDRDRSCEKNEEDYRSSRISAPKFVTRALKELLEAAQEECHDSYGFKLFGEFVDGFDCRQSERAKGEWERASRSNIQSTSDSGDLFSRYMTLLERLVAISWGQHEGRGNGKVIDNSFARPWLADHYHSLPSRIKDWAWVLPTDEVSKQDARMYVQEVYENCVWLLFKSFATVESSPDPPWRSAARDVSPVRKKLALILERKELASEDKINAEDCAKVARCIIVAWAFRVPLIDIEGKNSANAAFNELPPVMAFG